MMKKILMKKILIIISFSLLLTTTVAGATNTQLINKFCRTNYPGKKVKIISQDKLNCNAFTNRKNKRWIYVIKFRTKSAGTYGISSQGSYIKYNKYVKTGKINYVYYIYNPHTNYEDDVVARISNNKIIRFM